jgi:hypothetical protein
MTDIEDTRKPVRIAGFNVVELVGGMALVIAGISAAIVAQGYGLGTARNVGPGMFPMLLGATLALIGVGVVLEGRTSATLLPEIPWRPIIAISLGLAAFGLLVERAGAIAAVASLIFLAGLAEKKLRLVTLAGIAVVTVGFTAVLGWAFYGALTLDLLPRSR